MQVAVQNLKEKLADSRLGEGFYSILKHPDHIVGLNAPLEELKGIVLKEGVPVVVLLAPEGFGKSVLATMLCNDDETRAMYGDIFFVHVSKNPNFKVIVQELFHQKARQPSEFHSDEDAFKQLENLLREIGTHPVLLVLDDVWFESDIQKLMFQIPGYKILVTSRFEFPKFDSTYKLGNLNNEDAMTLFHHSGFPQAWSSDVPDDLVNEIVRGCEGFPLALVVVGQLFRQPEVIWRSVMNSLSNGKHILDSNSRRVHYLQTCIDALGEISLTECYLDLHSFPQDYEIPASAVMDIWAVYKLDEGRIGDTCKLLLELSLRNLVTLKNISNYSDGDDIELYDIEHYNIMQSCLPRELVIPQSSQEPIEQRRRLIIQIRGNDPPQWWTKQKHQPLHARLLSITTDDNFSSRWPDMQLHEVEVVILNFCSQNYFLPQFMKGMVKLTVLLVTNNGFDPVGLNNFELLGRVSNLRRIRLENILIPPFGGILVQMRNLQKISLSMCDMKEAFKNCTNETYDLLPNIEEISIDFCVNLVDFLAILCNLVNLKKLSISHCLELLELPEGLGRLKDLVSLKLNGWIPLEVLPDSIGDLKKLEVLDVSESISINELPPRLGELHSLIKLDIRGCLGLIGLPPSFLHLVQLKEVVCCAETHPLLESYEGLLPSLEVKVVNEIST